jgi:hypothetical protein
MTKAESWVKTWLIFKTYIMNAIKAQAKIGWKRRKRVFFPRRFGFTLNHEVKFWATPCMERWLDERLAFVAEHPGLRNSECRRRLLNKRFKGSADYLLLRVYSNQP